MRAFLFSHRSRRLCHVITLISATDGDGVFDGMVGDLQGGRVDLGFSQMFVKQERTAIIDFSAVYDFDSNCFLAAKPPPLPQFMALVKPLSTEAWLERKHFRLLHAFNTSI